MMKESKLLPVGCFLGLKETPTEEELKEAKEELIKRFCTEVKKYLMDCSDEMVIITDTSKFPVDDMVMTLGIKAYFPLIEKDGSHD